MDIIGFSHSTCIERNLGFLWYPLGGILSLGGSVQTRQATACQLRINLVIEYHSLNRRNTTSTDFCLDIEIEPNTNNSQLPLVLPKKGLMFPVWLAERKAIANSKTKHPAIVKCAHGNFRKSKQRYACLPGRCHHAELSLRLRIRSSHALYSVRTLAEPLGELFSPATQGCWPSQHRHIT